MSGSNGGSQKKTQSYINDFLYFVLRPDESREPGALVYCSGINTTRFLPLTRGRHGLGSNPAFRGLQLVRHGIRDLALARGAKTRTIRGTDCAGIAPTMETWYTEIMLIENAPDSFAEEAIRYGVVELIKKIVKACMLQEVSLPEILLDPDELQAFIENLCTVYGNATR
ncbi:MAG: hypothetical protein HGA78_10635 [Nitrospirales bacterium]|nr:hypothetical protein [Nitrospirales bacterium]